MPQSAFRLQVRREPAVAGEENMRRDAALLEHCATSGDAVLRLYTWARPTLSLGWMQNAATLVDLQACSADGIDVVRRPTGGRAILHDEEITYAFACSIGRPPFDGGLQETHRILAQGLQAGLAVLGIDTELSRPTHDPQRRLLGQPCFASSGRAELLVHGRKLLGSAQRRSRHAFVQHGSLLLGPAHMRIVDYLRETRNDPASKNALRTRMRLGTTFLGELLTPVPDFEVLCDALQRGFETRLLQPHEPGTASVS